ncbi:MAG TPA: NAD(P)/FAD-dependent oxidoreductase [Acetobacteraceae bacterium]|jgi:FAD-dependent urate hydroxylase|nr:NAD(P)/FAD-dependent oxidoreductase [Acetobacteraceae bacterium]
MTPAERALAAQVRNELALLAYPDRPWVRPVVADGTTCADVLVIGGGQSGLAIAHGLRRDAVTNVAVLDARPAGQEGVWEHFARMPELRTPKEQLGIEFGQPNLSVRAWHAARYGSAGWATFKRVPRQDWMAYLRWYREALDLPVENDVTVTEIRPGPRPGILAVDTSRGTRLARSVVLATGFEGAGSLRIPDAVSQSLPPDRYDHACTPIDFGRFNGKRIGILGHGASAFDAAVEALRSGAASVDLCFRRSALPVVNPHRFLDAPGLMAHWPALTDRVRWNIARHMRTFDQPPGVASFETAIALPGFRMHAASPWDEVSLDGPKIRVTTPRDDFYFDHVICATGYAFDLAARPELRGLAHDVVLWRDRFDPPADEKSAELGAYPYLAEGYEFIPRRPDDDWISRVHAFNFAALVSTGPHSTSISGHKFALPRLLRALVRRLFLEQQDGIIGALRAYDELDLVIPSGIQQETAHV